MVIAIELNGTQFWEKSGEWFEIASTITPELYDTKFCYQFIVPMTKWEKTVKKRQSKSKEDIREEKSLSQCFQSAYIRNLLDFDWLVSRHPRKKGILQLHWRTVLLFFFVIETLSILLHDHFISDLWLGVQSFIQFYFLYVRSIFIGFFVTTFMKLRGVNNIERSYQRAFVVISTVRNL